jgi:phosphoglycolate phosphatase
MTERPTLLLFDLDGTLIDSVGDLTAAINRLLAELGRAPLDVAQVRPMIGDGVGNLVEQVLAASPGGPADHEAAVARYVEFYEGSPADRTVMYPGVPETLEALHGRNYSLVVCTNKPERVTRAVLKALGIDQCFARVYGGDSLPVRKPDPRVIGLICAELHRSSDKTLFVGDSEVDAATAQAAGVPFVLMTYGYHRVPLAEIPRLAVLDNFADLPGYLDGL